MLLEEEMRQNREGAAQIGYWNPLEVSMEKDWQPGTDKDSSRDVRFRIKIALR